MRGGLMNLVAFGAQDIYLSGNPNITYFNAQYRRATHFYDEPTVENFGNFQNNDKYNQHSCVICLEDFNIAELIIIKKCGHIYHKNCDHVQLILCPMCRQ